MHGRDLPSDTDTKTKGVKIVELCGCGVRVMAHRLLAPVRAVGATFGARLLAGRPGTGVAWVGVDGRRRLSSSASSD